MKCIFVSCLIIISAFCDALTFRFASAPAGAPVGALPVASAPAPAAGVVASLKIDCKESTGGAHVPVEFSRCGVVFDASEESIEQWEVTNCENFGSAQALENTLLECDIRNADFENRELKRSTNTSVKLTNCKFGEAFRPDPSKVEFTSALLQGCQVQKESSIVAPPPAPRPSSPQSATVVPISAPVASSSPRMPASNGGDPATDATADAAEAKRMAVQALKVAQSTKVTVEKLYDNLISAARAHASELNKIQIPPPNIPPPVDIGMMPTSGPPSPPTGAFPPL